MHDLVTYYFWLHLLQIPDFCLRVLKESGDKPKGFVDGLTHCVFMCDISRCCVRCVFDFLCFVPDVFSCFLVNTRKHQDK